MPGFASGSWPRAEEAGGAPLRGGRPGRLPSRDVGLLRGGPRGTGVAAPNGERGAGQGLGPGLTSRGAPAGRALGGDLGVVTAPLAGES